MNARRDPDRLIQAFLVEGAEQLHDQVYDAVRADIEHRRQRTVLGPWRMPLMNKLVPIGLGSAAVVVALVASSQLLNSPAPGGIGGAPSASPTATPSPTPEPSVASPSPIAGLPEGPFVVLDASNADAAAEWLASSPSITVSIPAAGWTHDPQWVLLVKGTDAENVPEAAILFWPFEAGTTFYVPGDPCKATSTRPDTPVTTVDDLAAALAAQAARDASEPVDVTVGGYAGKSMTVRVPDDAVFDSCEGQEFVTYGTAVDPVARIQQGPGQIDELWILDVDGAVMVIHAAYRPNTPVAFIEEMRSIVQSATFEAP